MKIATYSMTPGLDRYPEGERFDVYRATHKRLMREDAAYRRQWSSYVAGIICVAVVPLGGFTAGGTLGIALSVLSLVGVMPGVIYLAFRQQRFMNGRIGDVLQRQ